MELPGLILRREVADQAADCGGKQKRRAEHDPADNAEHHLAALITDQVNSDKTCQQQNTSGDQEGYFSYERDGFGPVVETEEELLSELEKALARGCILEPVYEERAERFFERRDRKNCERNFDAIMQAAGEEKDG